MSATEGPAAPPYAEDNLEIEASFMAVADALLGFRDGTSAPLPDLAALSASLPRGGSLGRDLGFPSPPLWWNSTPDGLVPAAPEAAAAWLERVPPRAGGELDPEQAWVPETALDVLFQQYGGAAQAIDILHRGFARGLHNPDWWSDLGTAYRAVGKVHKAVQCFEMAILLSQQLAQGWPKPEHYMSLGNIYHVLGDFEEGIRMYDKGLQLNDRHSVLHFTKGSSLLDMGDVTGAVASLERALKYQPGFEPAQNLLNILKEDSAWASRLPSALLAVGAFTLLLACAQRAVSFLAHRRYSQSKKLAAGTAPPPT